MLHEEIVQCIYRFHFTRQLRHVHRQIKKCVQDGHKRRQKYGDHISYFFGRKWSSGRNLNKLGRIAWGCWKDGTGHTAAAYVCRIYEHGNLALKNDYYTMKSRVKSDAKIMEVFPAFYQFSWWKNKDILFRVKKDYFSWPSHQK